MHELEACETCRWWVPDPGTPPPVPRLNKFQPGECRMRSLGRPKRSDGWWDDVQAREWVYMPGLQEEGGETWAFGLKPTVPQFRPTGNTA